MGNPGLSGSQIRALLGTQVTRFKLYAQPHDAAPGQTATEGKGREALSPKPLLEKLRATSPELAPSHKVS